VTIQIPHVTKKRLRTAGIVAVVSAGHMLVLAVIAHTRPSPPMLPPLPPMNVVLFRPTPPPPPPPPPLKPTPDPGGGKPAAPSRVHVTPKPPPKAELPAPPRPAPEPALVIGAAPDASPTPGLGQGGTGNGTGTGDGDGEGSGSGGIGPRFVRGASQAEIFSVVPRGRRPGRGSVNCVIRLDQRLDDCRIVSETPPGLRYGAAAVTVAEAFFRFRPPMSASGRPVEGQRVTVFVQFGN